MAKFARSAEGPPHQIAPGLLRVSGGLLEYVISQGRNDVLTRRYRALSTYIEGGGAQTKSCVTQNLELFLAERVSKYHYQMTVKKFHPRPHFPPEPMCRPEIVAREFSIYDQFKTVGRARKTDPVPPIS